MLARVEVAALHRFHDPLVRGLLATSKLQRADQENVAQTVWLNVVRLWPEPAPDNAAAYITDMTRNAVAAFYRQQRRKKCDVRRTTRLMTEERSGPIDVGLVRDDDSETRVSRAFLRRHLALIATKCGADLAEIVCRLIAEKPVSAAERRRAIAALRRAMGVRAQPRGTQPRTELIEPYSQCGRAARELEAEADDDDEDENESDLAA